MKKQHPTLLGAIVRDYFTDHLPRVRGASPHTLHGYRDSIVLLLRFLSARHTPRKPWRNCRMLLALVSMTDSITSFPPSFTTAITMASLCTSIPIYLTS
jgi:hypothetical protein